MPSYLTGKGVYCSNKLLGTWVDLHFDEKENIVQWRAIDILKVYNDEGHREHAKILKLISLNKKLKNRIKKFQEWHRTVILSIREE